MHQLSEAERRRMAELDLQQARYDALLAERRYSPVLDVEPFPQEVDLDYRDLLRIFLDVSWSLLGRG
jgi:hypothetical protein